MLALNILFSRGLKNTSGKSTKLLGNSLFDTHPWGNKHWSKVSNNKTIGWDKVCHILLGKPAISR